MSLTGRPSRPPLALVSSSQIWAPSSACWPAPASEPLCAMLKPILMGSPPCAKAGAAGSAGESRAEPIPMLTPRRVTLLLMCFLQKARSQFMAPWSLPWHPSVSCYLTRIACDRASVSRSCRIATLHDHSLHLAGSGAAKSRGRVIFGRREAGDALLERRKLDDDKAVEFVRPFHDLIAAAAGKHFPAVLGDNGWNEIGIVFVFDRIVDLGTRNP